MNRSHLRRRILAPALATSLALAMVMAALVYSPQSVLADSSNVKNLNQALFESMGSASGLGAQSGVAIAFNTAPVQQLNIQVIAGDQATRDNSTQTATNTANIDQGGVAESGDTSAPAGGVANSGTALAGNLAVVMQLNVQVIAGIGCDVDQVANNTLDLSQQAGAVSGDASAGVGGDASSGSATAMNTAAISQRNIQVYVCRGGSTGQQVANNVGNFDQTTLAASGTADAGAGTATSGDASGNGSLQVDQRNVDIVID